MHGSMHEFMQGQGTRPLTPWAITPYFTIRTVSQSFGIGIAFLFMKIEIKTFCFNLLGQSKRIMKKATLLLKEKI